MRTKDEARLRRAWRRRLTLTLCTLGIGPCLPPCERVAPDATIATRPGSGEDLMPDSADDPRTPQSPTARMGPAARGS